MLGKILIGGVTLAAAGYAVNEYCEEYGCPWDDDAASSSSYRDEEETQEKVSYQKALDFRKQKKALYKTSMKIYREFLEKHGIKDDVLQLDIKLPKQKFPDTMVDDDISSYMDKIINTLETLSYNLALNIKFVGLNESKDVDEERLKLIQAYAKNIYALAHVAFFVDSFSGEAITKFTIFNSPYSQKFNKEEILSTLVEAMSLSVQKESIHVDLSKESNENNAA